MHLVSLLHLVDDESIKKYTIVFIVGDLLLSIQICYSKAIVYVEFCEQSSATVCVVLCATAFEEINIEEAAISSARLVVRFLVI